MPDKINHRKIIIPGFVASISGELEEELSGWEVLVGPREAIGIPSYPQTIGEGLMSQGNGITQKRATAGSASSAWNRASITVHVPAGTLLEEAIAQAGLRVPLPCGGQGRCGRCVVQVREGSVRRRSALRLSEEDIGQAMPWPARPWSARTSPSGCRLRRSESGA